MTGCLRPTRADNLPILGGIQPSELRRKGASLSPARRAMEPGHLLHLAFTVSQSWMHGVSNGSIHLYPPHNNSPVHVMTTTTQERR